MVLEKTGTSGIVIPTSGRELVEFIKKHRERVKEDVLEAFLRERL